MNSVPLDGSKLFSFSLPANPHTLKTWFPFIQQLCCTYDVWDPVLFLPLWSSQSLRWSRGVDTYHGKADECHSGDYMGHKSGKTEGWKLRRKLRKASGRIHTKAASWTMDDSLLVIQMETQNNRFSEKDNESSFGCEASSCLWDIQKGHRILESREVPARDVTLDSSACGDPQRPGRVGRHCEAWFLETPTCPLRLQPEGLFFQGPSHTVFAFFTAPILGWEPRTCLHA